MDRRQFMKMLAATMGGIAINPGIALGQDESGLWDVSYMALSDLESAFDVRDDIADMLGQGVASDLRVVRNNSGNLFRIIYDRDGEDHDRAVQTAANHTTALRKTDLFNNTDRAEAIRDEGYSSLYNVSFGVGRNLSALKDDMQEVRRVLGEGIGSDLVIEKRGDKYALVYQRRGTEEQAENTAERLHNLLRKSSHFSRRSGVLATPTRENGYELIAGETSVTNDRAPVVNNIQPSIGQVPKTQVPSPRTSTDSGLQSIINSLVKRKKAQSVHTRNASTSWVVFDYTTGELLVDINGDDPRQCASMVKPFVALAFFHKYGPNSSTYGSRSKTNMEAMIQRSSNSATNWVIDQVGGPRAVQKILTENYGSIFHDTSIVEKIPSGGRTYRNKASARDYSRFLHAMWTEDGRMPTATAREIRRLMALPGKDRLYNGAPDVPVGTLRYNKTGSTGMCIGDFGILSPQGTDGKRYPYHVIGIVERGSRSSNYGSFMSHAGSIIRAASNETYNWLQTNRHPTLK